MLDINDPPIIVISKKYKLRLASGLNNVSPELAKLLNILVIIFKVELSLKETNIKSKINIATKYKSSL